MRKRILTTFLALIAVAAASAQPVEAQTSCGKRDKIVSKLEVTYGESRAGAGLNGTTSIIEVWASIETGTWTILMSRPDGISCVMASGENWEHMPLVAPDISEES